MRVVAVSLGAAIGLLSATAVFAAGTGGSSGTRDSADDLQRAEKFIDQGRYGAAVPILNRIVKADGNSADAHNYLGFAYRNLGEYDKSRQHYDRALAIDPNHRGAREYLGELYLKLDQLDEAQQQLARLDEICTLGCSEYDELKSAIEKYRKSQ